MRTNALERPEAPLATAPFSHRTTRTPRDASAYAMLVPLTPPPTTTTSAVSIMFVGAPRPAGPQPRDGLQRAPCTLALGLLTTRQPRRNVVEARKHVGDRVDDV